MAGEVVFGYFCVDGLQNRGVSGEVLVQLLEGEFRLEFVVGGQRKQFAVAVDARKLEVVEE